MRWHFIGVGGAGMSAVARLVAGRGVQVSGTDRTSSAYFGALRAAGMDVRVGHDASLVDGADAVVVSTAVRDSNVELVRARELGVRVLHRSRALAWAVEGLDLVAVAGTHGKTTTSAMTACALHGAGIDATFAIGAKVFGVPGAVAGGYVGTSGSGVVEADESDGTFLGYHARVGVLTSVEVDHLDFFGTEEALHAAFTEFALACEVLVACADDPVVADIAHRARGAGARVITYGGEGADVVVTPESLVANGVTHPLRVPFPGWHNRLDAAAAWAAAVEMGARPERAASAIADFRGTGRRFEVRGEVAGVRVIDDYAHHPTEVEAVIAAARAAGAEHLVVLFQPLAASRTAEHHEAFARVLSAAQADIVLAPLDPSREDPVEGVDAQLIAKDMTVPVRVAHTLEEAAAVAASLAGPGTTVLTVGAGEVTAAVPWILAALEAR